MPLQSALGLPKLELCDGNYVMASLPNKIMTWLKINIHSISKHCISLSTPHTWQDFVYQRQGLQYIQSRDLFLTIKLDNYRQLTNSWESQTQWCSLPNLLKYLGFTVFGDVVCDLKVAEGTCNIQKWLETSNNGKLYLWAARTALTKNLPNMVRNTACILQKKSLFSLYNSES